MSIFDDIKGKAEGLVNDHGDAIKGGVENVGDWVDEKTGDKYKDHVDSVQQAATKFVNGAAK
ncbi:antitoxin [Arthrobacter polaris]|uniref:antitoxin n=1 Tax=Arthrobacter polaris TaxID=2813727 RepID=UPI001F280794|nr:antitoxin [Arthrobacter polaris]UIK89736.1 antitoxin [Arthrobacter polaris]